MRLVIMGDVGQPVYHAGDEAMCHAVVDELRARGADDVVILSRDPEQTRRLYGTDAARTLLFPWPPQQREAHMARVERALNGERDALPADDSFWAVLETVRSADALVISGGGNLNSAHGWLLCERVVLGRIAAKLGKRLVITGQTLGPTFLPPEDRWTAELLGRARLAGIREEDSLALAAELGANRGAELGANRGELVLVGDDAAFLDAGELGREARAVVGGKPYAAVTLAPSTAANDVPEVVEFLARTLAEAARLTGLDMLLLPHMGFLDENAKTTDDQTWHARIAAAADTPSVRPLPVLTAREVAAVTQRAALVVTSRYHPAVFGAAAAVPTVALSADEYSDVRLFGAMRNWGLGAFTVPLPGLFIGAFAAAIAEAWQRRDELAASLQALATVRRGEAAQWWDAVAAALSGNTLPGSEDGVPSGLSPAKQVEPAGEWAAEAAALRPWFRKVSRHAANLWLDYDRAQSDRSHLEHELAAARTEATELRNSRTFRTGEKIGRVASRIGLTRG